MIDYLFSYSGYQDCHRKKIRHVNNSDLIFGPVFYGWYFEKLKSWTVRDVPLSPTVSFYLATSNTSEFSKNLLLARDQICNVTFKVYELKSSKVRTPTLHHTQCLRPRSDTTELVDERDPGTRSMCWGDTHSQIWTLWGVEWPDDTPNFLNRFKYEFREFYRWSCVTHNLFTRYYSYCYH